MKNLKTFLLVFPEYYLIILVFLSGYTPPLIVNPISIVVILLIALQIFLRNGITGVILATVFLMVNIYMLLALLSEFSEFPIINSEALKLLGFGLFLFAMNLSASGLMVFKYTSSGIGNKSLTNGH